MNKEQITKECKAFANEVIKAVKITYPYFECPVKLDWGARRTTSWGGGKLASGKPKGISIAMAPYFMPMASKENPMLFHEYARIRNNSSIGEFWYDDIMLGYKAIICHEIAHAICTHAYPLERCGHKEKWQSHYHQLRLIFVNSEINKELIGSSDPKVDNRREQHAESYPKNCHKYKLKPEWFNKTYISGSKEMKIIGLNVKARKYPVMIQEVHGSQKVFKTTADDVRIKMTRHAN